MPLGTEVGLGPSHIVLDGDPAPPQGGHNSPQFSDRSWPNGWVDQDATWYRGRPRPRPHYARWGPSSPKWGHSSSPIFDPCLLWPNCWMYQLLLGTEVCLGPGDIVLYRDPAPATERGAAAPTFRPTALAR